MAAAAGVSLGDILEISEQTQVPPPRPYMAERAMAVAADAVPIATGENSYRVSVSLSIAIDQ